MRSQVLYSHGRAIVIEKYQTIPPPDDNRVTVLGRDNRVRFARAVGLDLADASTASVYDATTTEGSRLVVATGALNGQGVSAAFVQVYDLETGALLRIIRTGSVPCYVVSATDRGGIWCLGPDGARRGAGLDYKLLYRYSFSGVLEASALDASQFPADSKPWMYHPSSGTPVLRAGAEGVLA